MEMNCSIPFDDFDCILLGHGGGGRLTQRLIREVFYPAFDNPLLAQDHDGCVFPVAAGRMACSADSFVVSPLFFPGGNIGDLAVNGTVNDLACCGARPLYLTAGFIIEEGLPLGDLRRVVASMQQAARRADVRIIAGDTKVVERGRCDGLYIHTAGIGIVPEDADIAPCRAADGDVVICSGPIGVHGIAILSARESLGFETALRSDTAALHHLTSSLLANIRDVHVLRDPTRGGVATALNEIASAASVHIVLEEEQIPLPAPVRAAAEMLGLDPLYIANEGILLAILPEMYAGSALRILRAHPEGREAAIIGHIETGPPSVRLKTLLGGSRIVDIPSGEQLPRIC
ncbi:MAG: hydrogenase expression/formation protein HypE [Tannerellaceae bacterium]|jgi:hydrogenase expression/formation protein HypE|nr:hydrogenase expression/formation protein HypE [Tannerellaceae bacterium]